MSHPTDSMLPSAQAMVWDEHEVFDGWGSYPVELQFCPVFQVSTTAQQALWVCTLPAPDVRCI